MYVYLCKREREKEYAFIFVCENVSIRMHVYMYICSYVCIFVCICFNILLNKSLFSVKMLVTMVCAFPRCDDVVTSLFTRLTFK